VGAGEISRIAFDSVPDRSVRSGERFFNRDPRLPRYFSN
jgi:hypothetical protein